jgi:hypothetical protein
MKFITRPKSVDSKLFVKIEPGHSIEGVFRGDPLEFTQHWPQGGQKSLCTGPGCSECAAGIKKQFRFTINLVVKENAVHVAKIFENSGTVYDDLRALHEGGYDLEKTVVKITRKGNGKDTTYNILPKPNGTLSKEQEKVIAAVKLIDLANPGESAAVETQEEAPF